MKPIPIFRHVPHETAGMLADVLSEAGLAYQYVDLFRDTPAAIDCDGVPGLIVLGGPMNVDEIERYPHLAAEIEWIRDAVKRRLPILGICLGSQLLAKALGARVYPNGGKEIGWYELDLLPAAADDPLFAGLGEKLPVFQWHGDTFDLPAGAAHLARSPVCRHQAFRYENAWGLQFHIEVTAEMIHDWLGEPGNNSELATLPYIDPAAIRAELPTRLPPMAAAGQAILRRFANVMKM